VTSEFRVCDVVQARVSVECKCLIKNQQFYNRK